MEDGGRRLNKYLSDAGAASRREADRLIEEGRVHIRRKTRKGEPAAEMKPAKVGDRVYHGDTVYLNGKELPKKEPEKVYYLYNKPVGVICTADPRVPRNIIGEAGIKEHVTYAGRLDKDSGGLMILTNDGALIDRMMRASSWHEKEYVCRTKEMITDEMIRDMAKGVKIRLDDEATLRKYPEGHYVTTRPCRMKRLTENSFQITLTQGYNRQIRRMCKALGYTVRELTRTRIMSLTLGNLKPGESRRLRHDEVMQLIRESEKERVRKDTHT